MFYFNFIQNYLDNTHVPCYNFIANKVGYKVVTNQFETIISNWILVPHLLISLAINKTIKFVGFDWNIWINNTKHLQDDLKRRCLWNCFLFLVFFIPVWDPIMDGIPAVLKVCPTNSWNLKVKTCGWFCCCKKTNGVNMSKATVNHLQKDAATLHS